MTVWDQGQFLTEKKAAVSSTVMALGAALHMAEGQPTMSEGRGRRMRKGMEWTGRRGEVGRGKREEEGCLIYIA